MPWESLGTISVTDDWQFTAPVEAEIFRLTQLSVIGDYQDIPRGVVAQGFQDSVVNIFSPKIFTYRDESEIFLFNFPFGIQQHSLCLKRLSKENINWSIQAEYFTSENASEDYANYLLARYGELPDMSNYYSRELSVNLQPVAGGKDINAGVVTSLLDENPKRAYLTIRATSQSVALYAGKDESNNGVTLIAQLDPGEIYNIPVAGGIYRGPIYAQVPNDSTVNFTEFCKQ